MAKKKANSVPELRMPAEWEPHASTWIAWPHQASDWPGKMTPIPWVYAEFVRLLSQHELVNIVVSTATKLATVESILAKAGADPAAVKLWHWPTDRTWTRDSGPIFVNNRNKERVALDWKFNAWAKYDNYQHDNRLPKKVAGAVGVTSLSPDFQGKPIVLEGGSIDVNGTGLLISTEECLLSDVQCRNPGMTRSDYEAVFAKYLGIRKVLWLGRGIAGDDTHGHVDDLARFVNPTTIVLAVEENEDDENYAPTQTNLQRLRALTDPDGRSLEVVPIPMPNPVVFRKQRLPASYANFYIANGIVLVPTFNDPKDRLALGILADLFPDRTVVGVHCVDLVWGLGTLHCMTQQEPK
ncbi:MAG: agmatine deiminase family protein [Zavarzinella sp.]